MPSIKINMVDRQNHNWLIHHIYYRQSWLITVICCTKWSTLLWEETAGVLWYANAGGTKWSVQSHEIFSWSFPGLMICGVVKEPTTEKRKPRYGRFFFYRRRGGYVFTVATRLAGFGCFWLVARSPFVCTTDWLKNFLNIVLELKKDSDFVLISFYDEMLKWSGMIMIMNCYSCWVFCFLNWCKQIKLILLNVSKTSSLPSLKHKLRKKKINK